MSISINGIPTAARVLIDFNSDELLGLLCSRASTSLRTGAKVGSNSRGLGVRCREQ